MIESDKAPAPAGFGSYSELYSVAFRQAVIGEFVSSLMLLYITVGTIVYSQDRGGIAVENATQISICVGVTVTVLIYIFAGVSGAHFNSCFSFATALTGRISWMRCACYSVAQVAGMTVGAQLIAWGAPAQFARAGGTANLIQQGFSSGQALVVEVAITVFVFTMCLAAMDSERHQSLGLAGGRGATYAPMISPIVAGMAVTSALFFGIPVSSGCLNSSRALAVAIVSGNGWQDMWVFVVGPYLGAAAAAALYVGLFAGPGWHAQASAAICQLCGRRYRGGA